MILLPRRSPRLIVPLVLAAALFSVVCQCRDAKASEPASIAWRDDYGAAFDEARAANRLLWIQFTGPWCPNCTRMEQDSFPHPVVVQHARKSFVPLKLRSDVHEELALSFNLSALPATIIVAPSREVIAVHQGYLGPAEFDTFLRDSLARMPGKPAQKDDPDALAAAKPGTDQPKTDERIALEGYCAVSLVRDRKLVRGRPEHVVEHDGLTYHFASSAKQDLFRNEPERYAPANNGACPVTQLDLNMTQPGDPRWGILFQNRLYLFASEGARSRFVEQPEHYAMADVAEQGFCLHCIRDSGLLVRGDQRNEITREGWRYWFPDISHRDAFLTSRR